MELLTIIFAFGFINLSFSWQKYEKPIEIASPNKDGIYEFDLTISHKLTMARPLKYEKMGVLDFDVDSGDWYERDSNQLAPCNKTDVLIKKNEESMKDEILKDVIQLDGLHHRMITINGKTPGDPIVVPFGAEVVMRVKNRLNTEGITLHVHGLDKRDLWFTDGVAHVQQCPIAVGSDFTYRFIADSYGTHWYHGHLASDRAEGLLGGFVVKDPGHSVPDPSHPEKRLHIKRDYYSMLQDFGVPEGREQHYSLKEGIMKWVSGLDGERKNTCWAPTRTYDGSNVGGSIPMSSFVVGDKGWHNENDQKTKASKLPLTTYLIKEEEDILVRFVNGGVAQGIFITLEGHQMTVVAADGVEVKPVTLDGIMIFGGERYDVLIRGLKNPKQKQYRFIFETIEKIHWNWGPYEPFIGLANLEYESDKSLPEKDEIDFKHSGCTKEKKCKVLNCPFGEFAERFNFTCMSAHLLEYGGSPEHGDEVPDPEVVQKKKLKNFDERFINMHFDSHVDGYMFSKPRGIPYYHEGKMGEVSTKCDPKKCDRQKASKYDHEHCDCFINYKFKLGDIVQLVIYNMGDGGKAGTGYSHPFHMHGTHFYVMKMGYPEYYSNGTIKSMNRDLPCDDITERCLDLKWRNSTWMNGTVDGMQKNPSMRDTVMIPTGGYTVIRFRADNPGWWFAHCHLMLHHMGGTAFAFRIGNHEDLPVPPGNFPHDCGNFEDYEIPKKRMMKRF